VPAGVRLLIFFFYSELSISLNNNKNGKHPRWITTLYPFFTKWFRLFLHFSFSFRLIRCLICSSTAR